MFSLTGKGKVKSDNKTSPLVNKVVSIVNNSTDKDEVIPWLEDVRNYGCVSGMVGELIYYTDTAAWYKKYKREIVSLLTEYMLDTMYSSPTELFGDKWEYDDPFCEEQNNQNLLAWFSFENVCYNILCDLEV